LHPKTKCPVDFEKSSETKIMRLSYLRASSNNEKRIVYSGKILELKRK
jgi:hypothetical protein